MVETYAGRTDATVANGAVLLLPLLLPLGRQTDRQTDRHQTDAFTLAAMDATSVIMKKSAKYR